MFDSGKKAMMKKMMGQITPSEMPLAQAFAESLANIEHDQLTALEGALETAGGDPQIDHDVGDRRDQLLEVADAIAGQEFERWWFEQAGLENVDVALELAGMDGEEWHDQLRTWYRRYHDAGVVDAPLEEVDPEDVGHIAAMHVRETFDVELDEFVANVVNFERGRAAQDALAGPLQRVASMIRALDQRMAQMQGRVAALEEENKRLRELVDEEDLEDLET